LKRLTAHHISLKEFPFSPFESINTIIPT
jgi:hypothetical protein